MNMLLKRIENAFSHRANPRFFLLPRTLAKHECDDLMKFFGHHWSTITCAQLEKHFEAIYWLPPEGFCYYLPGIFSASVQENQPELIVNHSLISMLDRSPERTSWDKFFLDRWTMLTFQECEVTQEWLLWITDNTAAESFCENSLSRAFDTLELLKERAR